MTASYPLAWPLGRPRTPAAERKPAAFRSTRETFGRFPGRSSKPITIADARERLSDEMDHLRATLVVLSTNVALRLDGQPRSGASAPADPGVALYFQLKGKSMVLACDRWDSVAGNMAAIAAHVEALRGQTRWGVGTTAQAFAGFEALPAPGPASWRATLGFPADRTVSAADVQAKRRAMAKEHHADAGGRGSRMAEINAAADEALRDLSGASP